jgi:alpha,alpha-trehalase
MKTPDLIYGNLFKEVQLSGIFPDSKTFVDMVPRMSPEAIMKAFGKSKNKDGFDLKQFVESHFELPVISGKAPFESDKNQDLSDHISSLWPYLTRSADKMVEGSSLIPLPYPYVVPGGRFKEIYYWDSYFTMLGLSVDGKQDLIENMVRNFAFLIDTAGHIPNGNRTYFMSRSQPPFFALMVDLLAGIKGEDVRAEFLPQLRREYSFWMNPEAGRVVKTEYGSLNRYWDASGSPRQESYAEDVELADAGEGIFRHLRAACESGWDFSSRWLKDPDDLRSIHCADILPVDLNSLLYFLEKTISKAADTAGYEAVAINFRDLAIRRKTAIQSLYLNPSGFYADFDLSNRSVSSQPTLAMMFPLFFGIASQEAADRIAALIEKDFLKPGGLLTTLIQSGQQWDAPNGWPPLHWISVIGLKKYGHVELAGEIARRWTGLNERIFKNTGKMMEKYNVVDANLFAGGGEYPVQDGFGWTNGVFLAFKAWLSGDLDEKYYH